MTIINVFITPRDEREDAMLDSLGYKLGPEDANGVNCRSIGSTVNPGTDL